MLTTSSSYFQKLENYFDFEGCLLKARASVEQAIGTLQVGDQVQAYNPDTGKVQVEPVQHVFVNHDSNLVDVTLAPLTTKMAQIDQAAVSKQQGPPETIHTTTEHPFLTTDRGWVNAQDLRVGEHVQRLNGSIGVVRLVQVILGEAVRYNLTIKDLHTFVVGTDQWVVHNCLWKPTDFNGVRVYQRDDLIDLTRLDNKGRTSLQRMMKDGSPPIGPDGEPIQLHHMLQTQDSPLAEVTNSFHNQYKKIIHINPQNSGMGLGQNRGAFNNFRRSYWRWRAQDLVQTAASAGGIEP